MPETSSSCAGPGGPLAPLGGQCPGVEARNKAGCGSASHGARGIFSGERLQGGIAQGAFGRFGALRSLTAGTM